jgi:hypothetical protein
LRIHYGCFFIKEVDAVDKRAVPDEPQNSGNIDENQASRLEAVFSSKVRRLGLQST